MMWDNLYLYIYFIRLGQTHQTFSLKKCILKHLKCEFKLKKS